MITLRLSQERGEAYHNWLSTKHSFSFANYYDPQQMGFSALRVINDDIIKPRSGFETHGHRDMEIITFILSGSIQHKDSEGNSMVLTSGEYQLMSAGRGIYHSEFNASATENLQLLQIWIEPNVVGKAPSYQQKSFGTNRGLTTIASPTGQDGAFSIKQDAYLHQLVLEPGTELNVVFGMDRKIYVHHVSGLLSIEDITLSSGDGAKIVSTECVLFSNRSDTDVFALVFDLP